jgi:mono/diheme cytochrome c family protein
MSDRRDERADAEAAGEERHEHGLRHPLESAEHEVARLKEIVDDGKSAATPAILAVTWIAIVLPLLAVVVALAYGVAYLVTGSAVAHYPAAPTAQTTQSAAADGRTIFAQNCAACHGATGHGGFGPDLTTLPAARNDAVVVHQVTFGGGGMPPFKGTLDDQQIHEVAAYVSGVIARGGS